MNTDTDNFQASKREELQSFILLAIVLAPVLSVAIVGSWGFVVWMSQLIMGPPH